MLRRIVSRVHYATKRKDGKYVKLSLECGHVVHRRVSEEPRRQLFCYECNWSNGAQLIFLKPETGDA